MPRRGSGGDKSPGQARRSRFASCLAGWRGDGLPASKTTYRGNESKGKLRNLAQALFDVLPCRALNRKAQARDRGKGVTDGCRMG